MRRHWEDIHADIRALQTSTHGKFVSRRAFTAGLAAVGLSPLAVGISPASASDPDLVLVNWGGDAVPAMTDAYIKPFLTANPSERAKIDTSGPSNGKIKAMVDAKRVVWDLCDRVIYSSLQLGPQGLLEEVDYSVVDAAKTLPGVKYKWGVPSYSFGNVLTYRSNPSEPAPSTWADFWNIKDFPGGRTLRRHIESTLEVALLADGVEPSKLYPLDTERAFRKLLAIKDRVTFWSSHADSYKLMFDGEATMGCLAHTRAILLRRDTQQKINFTFNQGIFWVSGWIVPKGNPGGKRVWRLIAQTLEPESQIAILKSHGFGPVNPTAVAMITPEFAALNPSSPDNYARMIHANYEWHAENGATVLNQFLDKVLS